MIDKMQLEQGLLDLLIDLDASNEKTEKLLTELTSDDVRARVNARHLAYFGLCRMIRKKKQADYGLTWQEYGLDGVFFNIASKFGRLKSLIWHRKEAQVKDESVLDTLLDLVNYALYAIFLFEEGNFRGEQK